MDDPTGEAQDQLPVSAPSLHTTASLVSRTKARVSTWNRGQQCSAVQCSAGLAGTDLRDSWVLRFSRNAQPVLVHEWSAGTRTHSNTVAVLQTAA